MKSQDINYHFLSLLHTIIIIGTILILLVLLLCSTGVFIRSINDIGNANYGIEMDKDQKEKAVTKGKELLLNSESTHMNKQKRFDVPSDSIAFIMFKIDFLEKQQETVLSDLRQECNNIINKVNGWLAFWIAILTIFGAIIPMVIQYILRLKSKKEVEELIEIATEKSTNCQLQMLVSSMEIQHQYSILADNSNQRLLLRLLLDRAFLSINSLLRMIKEKNKDISEEEEVHLINALMQYSQIVEILMIKSTSRKTRELNQILDRIKKLVIDIMNHTDISRHKILNQLTDLLPELSALSIE